MSVIHQEVYHKHVHKIFDRLSCLIFSCVSFSEFENNFLTIFHHSLKKNAFPIVIKTNKQKQHEAKIIVGYLIFLKVAVFLFSHSMQHTLDCIFQWKLTMNVFPLCAPSTYILSLWLQGP